MEPKLALDLLEHTDFVRAVVRGLLADEHAVDDVVQETCLRALERPPQALRAWLARVARNLALTAMRRDKARGRREHGAARPEGQPSAGEAASRLERHRLVVEAVLALEEPFRSAILLRFYDDLPPREIARELGVPVDTVRSRLRRGLERLRAHLDARHGGDRAAWSLALLPLLGARATKFIAGGALMGAKTKLSVAAVLVCIAAVGTVTWQSAARGDRAARSEFAHRAAEVDGVRGPETAPEAPAVPLGATAPDAAGAEPAASAAEQVQPYRLAESTGDARGALRIVALDDAGNGIAKVNAFLSFRMRGEKLATGLDGRAELRSLDAGQWSVSVHLCGRYRSADAEVVDGRWTEVVVVFARGAAVEGEVRHVERGPLADMGVAVETGKREGGFYEWFRTSTDAAGRYRLEGLPAGTYPVIVWGGVLGQDQHPRAMLTVPGPGTVTRDIVVGKVALRGAVRDARTGAPLADAKVRVGQLWHAWAEATTLADGAYEILDLPGAALCHFEVERDGYVGQASAIDIAADGSSTADFELQRAAVLLIEVLDADGRPVPGKHEVSLWTATGQRVAAFVIIADGSGVGRYAGALPGTYDLVLEATGYVQRTQRVEIGPDANRLTFRLAPAENLGRISLEGVVRDAETKKPVAGACVRVARPSSGDTTTGPDGTYRLRDLKPGAVTIVTSVDGYGRCSLEAEIGAEPRTLDIELDPAATMRLHVTDRAGAPVRGKISLVIVGRDNTTDRGTEVSADADGQAVYRQIMPGSYHLLVSQTGVGEAKVETVILAGENIVRVRLE